MTSAGYFPIVVVTCGPPPEGWWEALEPMAVAQGLPCRLITLPPSPRLPQATEALGAIHGPAVILAPRSTGVTCALTMARLVSPLPVLEWHPDTLPEALDTAARILQLVQSPIHPPTTAETVKTPPSQEATEEKKSPVSVEPPYVKQRRIRLGREDHLLVESYEEQLRKRIRPAAEPLPPPPLKLSLELQAALSHAGARAVANSDGELSIDSSLVLLCLIELGNGGIVDALQAAGYQTANMAESLAAIIQAPPIDDSLLANLKNRRGVVPDPSLRALLEQTRREGRSREAPVATTRDFLRSILATDGKARDALAAIGVNLDLLRELLDEQHFPDQEELATEDEVEEPLAQPGWTDPLSGLDPLTRQELLQGTPSPPSGAPLPVTDPSTLRPTAGTETNSPISSSAPQAPTRAGRPMRRMTLYNSENPSPEMIDAVTDLLESGRMVVFPSDCGLHALVRLDLEEPAAQLLRYRRALNLPASEVLLHNMRVAGDFPSEGSLQTHRAILGDLGDYRVAVRLPWQRRHGAIESLDETPGSGWHLGWRIPAHTSLLAVLANLNRPVLALRADESDPALDRLQNHDSQPVAMAVTPARPVMPISPAVIDLRSERPRIDHPGSPAVDAEEIRRFLQWNPA